MPMSPDVLLVPSRLATFARKLDNGTLVVNPGQLARGSGGGTFASLTIGGLPKEALEQVRECNQATFPYRIWTDSNQQMNTGFRWRPRSRARRFRIKLRSEPLFRFAVFEDGELRAGAAGAGVGGGYLDRPRGSSSGRYAHAALFQKDKPRVAVPSSGSSL